MQPTYIHIRVELDTHVYTYICTYIYIYTHAHTSRYYDSSVAPREMFDRNVLHRVQTEPWSKRPQGCKPPSFQSAEVSGQNALHVDSIGSLLKSRLYKRSSDDGSHNYEHRGPIFLLLR